MSSLRLQKYIADCGVTSRRKAEELIVQGRVEVNGEVTRVLGTKVDPATDVVTVDGDNLSLSTVEKLYILLHKPRGFVTTVNDPEGRKTVMDLIPEVSERVYPVGRLDYLSEGLLLMTNDGDLAQKISHPSNEVIKVYEVKVFGLVTQDTLKSLREGVRIDGRKVKPKSVRIVKQLREKTWLEFRLGEGRNREIRRICEECSLTVDKLKRVAIGQLTIDGLAPGKAVYLKRRKLLEMIGFGKDGKLVTQQEYFSPKKSVRPVSVAKIENKRVATDESFKKFRREAYFDTLKRLKEIKKEKAKQERAQFFAEKEEARKKRVLKKKRRQEQKEATKKGPHAMFVD